MQDFAQQMRWLVDEAYPEVAVVRVVLDNLNTHRVASLYETYPADEARRIARRLEFHYTPKHGSWLNMAEIEFSVLARSCLKQRLPDQESLRDLGARAKRRVTINGWSIPNMTDYYYFEKDEKGCFASEIEVEGRLRADLRASTKQHGMRCAAMLTAYETGHDTPVHPGRKRGHLRSKRTGRV